MALTDYWDEHPPMNELLEVQLRHQGWSPRKATSASRPTTPSELAALAAAVNGGS